MRKDYFGLISLLTVLLWAGAAFAHLAVVEPERMRSDNFFIKGGFAERQIGECVPKPNDPNGIFCNFRNEDDWSFKNPVLVIEETRVPQPGLPGVPGFAVQCSNNFNCPLPPPFPGGPHGFGTCVAGPTGGTCDLSAGSPRPNAGVFLSSTLVTKKDVDVAAYDYLAAWGDVTIVGIPQTPACKSNIHFFPTIAFAGPLNLVDGVTGAPLFLPLSGVNDLPRHIIKNLPPGYGIRVTRPPDYRPSKSEPRPGFYSGFGQNAWLYQKGTQIDPCIENAASCEADPTSTHFAHNDIFHLKSPTDVRIYAMWWGERGFRPKVIRDVGLAIGTLDNFTPGDFAALEFVGKAFGNGRTTHGQCRDPQPTGKVDIYFEGPPEENNN